MTDTGSLKPTHPESFAVTFLPQGKRVLCGGGDTLLEIARRHSVRIASACGGRGRCRSCAVRIEGAVPEAGAADLQDFSTAHIAAGWRRACQTRLIGSCTVHVPAKTAAATVKFDHEEGAISVPIRVPVLQAIPGDSLWRHGEHIVGPIAGGRAMGLAVDLGTTSMAASLVDMQSGEVLATAAKENPQSIFGADVITRCMHALHKETTARELQRVAVEAIADLAAGVTGGHPEQVGEVAVVGNSVMEHLLLALPVGNLARAPYRPEVFDAVEVSTASIGLELAPGAELYCGPNIAGFVGSDHVAALLETMANPPPGRWALLDIGTNTEISVFVDGTITSASCPSGPAFEGGSLSCGMPAAPGAIERVRIEGENLRLETIGGVEPIGICGSGVLSLVSELYRAGALNRKGRLAATYARVRERDHRREFVLAGESEGGALSVVFTQDDVRAVQLAKAAVRTGLDMLLAEVGLKDEQLDRLIVAGAFGKHIDVDEAIGIGMLPALPSERILQVGNAAGAGVRRLLACAQARAQANALARQAHYVELAARPTFQRAFMSRIEL